MVKLRASTDYLEHERALRDSQASNYEQFISEYQHLAEWQAYSKIIAGWSGTIADIGCGTGRFTRQLVAPDRRILAYDFSLKSLDFARRMSPPGITFALADVRSLPLKNSTVEHVISTQVYEHLIERSDTQKYFDEIARVLKPGATALVSGYAYSFLDLLLGRKLATRGSGIRFVRYSVSELRQFLCASGLRLVAHKKIIVFTRYPIDRLAKWITATKLADFDRWFSPIFGNLWGALTVLVVQKTSG